MITTNSKIHYKKLCKLRGFGIEKTTWKRYKKLNKHSWYYDIKELGYKSNMFDIQAAIGLAQLKKIDQLNKRRLQIAKLYDTKLGNIPGLELPPKIKNQKNIHWLYTIKTDRGKRDKFIQYMYKKGIHSGVHWRPAHQFTFFRRKKRFNLPKSQRVWKRIADLPIYPNLSNEEINYIITCTKKFFEANQK